MSEFIREVDEEYRQDRIRTVLMRYRAAIVAGLVLILVGVGAYEIYGRFTQQRAESAGGRYFDATDRTRTDHVASIAALDDLAKTGPAGYALLARFRAAGLTGSTDAAAGAKAFDALADDASVDPDLRDVARLRAAMLLMDSASPAELRRRFDPLADANSAYRNTAREMLGYLALSTGDDAAAGKTAEAILADRAATPDQRQQANLMLGLVRSGKAGPAAKP